MRLQFCIQGTKRCSGAVKLTGDSTPPTEPLMFPLIEMERNRQFCLTKYVFPHVSYSSCLYFVLFYFLFHLVCRDQDGNMSDIPQIWSSSKENIHQTRVSEGKHFPGLCEEGITCNIYTVKCLQTTRHCYTCCYVLILTLSQLLTTFKPR